VRCRLRERSEQRVNSRNGYRSRDWDTRVAAFELAIPKLRSGSYFPDWLLERRRRAEQALVSVVATSYLLGVSTRRVEKLVAQLGIAQLSKSQASTSTPRPAAPVPLRWRPHRYGATRPGVAPAGRPSAPGGSSSPRDPLPREDRRGRTVIVHALVAVGAGLRGWGRRRRRRCGPRPRGRGGRAPDRITDASRQRVLDDHR
jgi:hypothetical protein